MTSVLNVDTIAAKNGTSPVALTKQAAAKHFAHWDSSATIQDSLNASSATDNTTGEFSVTITSAMSNANYIFLAGNGSDSTIVGSATEAPTRGSKATNGGRISVLKHDGSLVDNDEMFSVFHGDLA
jgi:hypothetical protein